MWLLSEGWDGEQAEGTLPAIGSEAGKNDFTSVKQNCAAKEIWSMIFPTSKLNIHRPPYFIAVLFHYFYFLRELIGPGFSCYHEFSVFNSRVISTLLAGGSTCCRICQPAAVLRRIYQVMKHSQSSNVVVTGLQVELLNC